MNAELKIKERPDPYMVAGSIIVTKSLSAVFITDGKETRPECFSGTQIYVSDCGMKHSTSVNWGRIDTRPLEVGESFSLAPMISSNSSNSENSR